MNLRVYRLTTNENGHEDVRDFTSEATAVEQFDKAIKHRVTSVSLNLVTPLKNEPLMRWEAGKTAADACFYSGIRTDDGLRVSFCSCPPRLRRGLRSDLHNSGPLPLRLDLENHSPTGFECGYGGSGPAQLAVAILAHALGDDEQAARLHQPFKARVISNLPQDADWQLTLREVLVTVKALEREGGAYVGR